MRVSRRFDTTKTPVHFGGVPFLTEFGFDKRMSSRLLVEEKIHEKYTCNLSVLQGGFHTGNQILFSALNFHSLRFIEYSIGTIPQQRKDWLLSADNNCFLAEINPRPFIARNVTYLFSGGKSEKTALNCARFIFITVEKSLNISKHEQVKVCFLSEECFSSVE